MYNQNRKKIRCPRCGKPTKVWVVPGTTTLQQFPLWCEKCKKESTVDFDGVSQRLSRQELTS